MIDPISIIGLGLAAHTLTKLKTPKKPVKAIQLTIALEEEAVKTDWLKGDDWFKGDEGWEEVNSYLNIEVEEEVEIELSPLAKLSDQDSEGWSEYLLD